VSRTTTESIHQDFHPQNWELPYVPKVLWPVKSDEDMCVRIGTLERYLRNVTIPAPTIPLIGLGIAIDHPCSVPTIHACRLYSGCSHPVGSRYVFVPGQRL
jgi:hypothetical protein